MTTPEDKKPGKKAKKPVSRKDKASETPPDSTAADPTPPSGRDRKPVDMSDRASRFTWSDDDVIFLDSEE